MRERRVNLYKIGVLCIEVMYIDIRYCLNGKTLYSKCSHACKRVTSETDVSRNNDLINRLILSFGLVFMLKKCIT